MKKFLVLVLAIALTLGVSAQNETKKWAFGGGVSAIDFSGPITKSYFDFDEFKGSGRFFVGRYLNPSFNAKLDFTFGKVWFPKVTAYPETIDGFYELAHIYDAGLTFEYKFNNGYIFKETAVVAPYIFSGIGMNSIIDYPGTDTKQSDINAYVPFGLGFNIRPADWLTINLQSAYKMNIDNAFDYTQHSASLVFNLGKQKADAKIDETEVTDSDEDGVPDLIDECPFAAGTKDFFGCPDTDGDGLGDSRDNCPNEAGPADTKGCPSADADGDGVPDDKDSCPNLKGEKRYAGCPDTDGDGIVDKYDKCPDLQGVASNNGCPKDETPDVISTPTAPTTPTTPVAPTTPVVTEPIVGQSSDKYIVYFGSSVDAISATGKAEINKAMKLLEANPSYKVRIKGYADSQGDEISNVELSLRRAQNVWKYMNGLGLKGDRAELYGMGEYFPQSNTNSKNRRVELEIVK